MIVAIAGRRVDPPDAKQERFPSALTASVKGQLLNLLKSVDAKHVVSSGACGTDLLALEAALELAIPATMVLPFDFSTFKVTSVTDRPGNWGKVYDDIIQRLRKSKEVIELDYNKDDPDAYAKTNLLILDEAQKKAEYYQQKDANTLSSTGGVLALIVWEGKPKDAEDTTFHFMQEAQKRNFLIREIRIME